MESARPSLYQGSLTGPTVSCGDLALAYHLEQISKPRISGRIAWARIARRGQCGRRRFSPSYVDRLRRAGAAKQQQERPDQRADPCQHLGVVEREHVAVPACCQPMAFGIDEIMRCRYSTSVVSIQGPAMASVATAPMILGTN